MLLTIANMLYIMFPGITYFITGRLYILTTFTHFASSNTLPLQPLFSGTMGSVFVYVFLIPYKSEITVFVFLYFTCSSIIPSRSIHLVKNYFFCGCIIFHCVHIPHFLYEFNHWCSLRLFPCLGY